MDYSGLKTAISSYLHRTGDTQLEAMIDTFIDLAESFLSRQLARMGHPYMEARATANSTSGWVALPSDYMSVRELSFGGEPLQLVANEVCQEHDTDGGDPKYFCVTDGQFRIAPATDTSTEVEIVYYQRLPALSDSDTSNWLLVEAEDLYLMACLVHAGTWARDAELVAMAREQVAVHLQSMEGQIDTIKYGDAPLTVLARGHS